MKRFQLATDKTVGALGERRDRGLHAADAPRRHAPRQEADGRAQGRQPLVASSGRQDPGDGGVQAALGWVGRAAQGAHRRDLDAARGPGHAGW